MSSLGHLSELVAKAREVNDRLLNDRTCRLGLCHPYVLTSDGQRVAVFYTKLRDRLLDPLLSADRPPT